jgi:Phosphoserine phosphatase
VKLLVFDVEGTLFRAHVRLPGTVIDSTVWQGLAHRLGDEAVKEEVATHARWTAKGYKNYIEWMRDTIEIHLRHGLTRNNFYEVIDAAEYNPGVQQCFAELDRSRYEPVLISGGFRELAARAQRDLRIIHSFTACEYLFGEDGHLQGFNLLPCDFMGKIDFIQLMLREYGLSDDDWVFVGDGLNDVPIASKAPFSIGYRAHEQLCNVVTHVVDDFRDISKLLA